MGDLGMEILKEIQYNTNYCLVMLQCKVGELDDLQKFIIEMKEKKNPEDKNKWRVPTWRNVALTAPYFHNGRVKTLDEAIRVMAKTQLDMELKDEQVKDIVAFLNSLTGKFPQIVAPRLPMLVNDTLTPEK